MLTTEEHIAYWKKLAESDLEVARGFLRRGHDLHYCLFFGHMSLEKIAQSPRRRSNADNAAADS
jgi:hypothetical protein